MASLAMLGSAPIAQGDVLLKGGTQESARYEDASIVDSPQPDIPPEMHESCFKSCCIARFVINPDGKHLVSLISSSGSEDVDDITLSTLRRWKFKPAMLNGKPVRSTRKIKVEFEVSANNCKPNPTSTSD
ncbi:MAG TPA: energy transducer TonB [Candidatus Obscuribacterales bacterium]